MVKRGPKRRFLAIGRIGSLIDIEPQAGRAIDPISTVALGTAGDRNGTSRADVDRRDDDQEHCLEMCGP